MHDVLEFLTAEISLRPLEQDSGHCWLWHRATDKQTIRLKLRKVTTRGEILHCIAHARIATVSTVGLLIALRPRATMRGMGTVAEIRS
jgi:UDP-3-O-acyl-N-acetylglucosamine deacetylase